MPYKDPEKQKASQHNWYLNRKEEHRRRDKERKDGIRNWYAKLKLSYACSRCGENHPACLDFHHRNPIEKDGRVSQMAWHGFSKKRILEEMSKCDVLCSNCHRKEHYKGNGIIRKRCASIA